MSARWDLHANGDCWPDNCRACQYEDDLRADWPVCDEHGETVDPEETAPSCGVHVLCVACYETADFDCRECLRVRRELDDEEFGKWVGSGWAS